MTRLCTIQPGDIPSPMMADYYGQRVSEGGLEIRGVNIPTRSYLGAASFYYDGQMEDWRAIANAVQAKGSSAFVQLIHGGRQSHVEVTGGGDSIEPGSAGALPLGRPWRALTAKRSGAETSAVISTSRH
jgi:N-ethylmaleimide reductase